MQKRVTLVAGLSLACLLMAGVPAQASGIKVIIDGVEKQFSPGPVIKNNLTLVPMRDFFQSLGAQVDWDGSTSTVTGTKGNLKVKLTIGSDTAYVNNEKQTLEIKAQLLEDKYTYIPLRFVGTGLGAEVDWDGSSKTITVTSKVQTTTPTKPTVEKTPSEFPELNVSEAKLSSFSSQDKTMLVSYLHQIDTLARLQDKKGFEYSTLSYLYRSAGTILATKDTTKADATLAFNNSLASAQKYLAAVKATDYTPYLTAAEAAKAAGQNELAATYYVKALEFQADTDLRLQLAKLYLKMNKLAEAEPQLEQVITADKGFVVGSVTLPNLSRVEAIYLKANLLWNRGDKEGAKPIYSEFLQLAKQWEDSGYPFMLFDEQMRDQAQEYKKLANSRI